MLVSIAPFYVICWSSELLKNEIAKTLDIVYELPWYLGSVSNKKIVLMIMLRVAKPTGVTMAKFYIVSLQSFLRVRIITEVKIKF